MRRWFIAVQRSSCSLYCFFKVQKKSKNNGGIFVPNKGAAPQFAYRK